MPSKNPGLPWLHAGTGRWRGLVLLLAIALIAADGRRLDGPDPRPPRWHASSSTLNDCQMAAEARRSVMADPALADLNIGITVVDGSATVWGGVPDADIAARVRSRLSVVAGISTVIDDLRIDPDSRLSPLRSAVASQVNPPVEWYKPGLASGYPRGGRASFADAVPPMTIDRLPAGDPARSPAVTLLKPTLTDTNLADQLETLRRSTSRFRDLGVRSIGSVVYLRPCNAPSATVLEFAGRISHLQGVSRVLIEDSRRPSSLAIP